MQIVQKIFVLLELVLLDAEIQPRDKGVFWHAVGGQRYDADYT